MVLTPSRKTITMNSHEAMDDSPSGFNPPTIQLDRFLKWQRLVQTGGEAKIRIQEGEVLVNGVVETRRGRKLIAGDRVTIFGETYPVEFEAV